MSVDLLAQIGALKSPTTPQPGGSANRPGSSVDFGNTLESLLDQHQVANAPATSAEEGTEEVVFSRHAKARLESRGIELDAEQFERLGEGIDQLGQRVRRVGSSTHRRPVRLHGQLGRSAHCRCDG